MQEIMSHAHHREARGLVLCILHIMRTRCHAVVANILLACVATVLVAFLASPRSSHQDVQTPVLVRVLQGPHTDAQFYTTPAFSKQLEWFRRAHFGPADPHMSGVNDLVERFAIEPYSDFSSK